MGGEGRNTQQNGWDDPEEERQEIARKKYRDPAGENEDRDRATNASIKTVEIRGRTHRYGDQQGDKVT